MQSIKLFLSFALFGIGNFNGGLAGAVDIDRAANEFLTPLTLNKHDTLNFDLVDGETRNLVVLDSGVDVYSYRNQIQWLLWADLEVDGQATRVTYEPFSMKAQYEPRVVNGMRIGLDGVQGLADAVGIADRSSAVNPSRDIRLWVNDASMPVIPNAHLWFDLYQDRTASHPSTYGLRSRWPQNDDYRIRQDRDLHPTTTDLTYSRPGNGYTNKTGWLGGWDYGFHTGLDVQLPIQTNLYAVTDGATQRGFLNSSWHGAYYDVDHNGDRWRFGNLHSSSFSGTPGDVFESGSVIALSGDYRAGIPHVHTDFSYRAAGSRNRVPLNPWIAMWQGLENRKQSDGVLNAAILPVRGGRVDEAISFSSSNSNPGRSSARELVEYFWLLSDGTTSKSPSLEHIFKQPGMYQAILIVDDGRLKDLDEVFFTIDGEEPSLSTPRITRGIFAESDSEQNPQLPHVGSLVSYSLGAESPDGNSLIYRWRFSDGTQAEGLTATYNVTTPGRHFTIVTVTDAQTGRSVMDWHMLDTWEWPAVTPVPEPPGANLLVLAAFIVLRNRRSRTSDERDHHCL